MKKTQKLQIPTMSASQELIGIIMDMISIFDRIALLEPSEAKRFGAILQFYQENENHPDMVRMLKVRH